MSEEMIKFEKAAFLVKNWGQSLLENGKTLEEILTIEGVSLWSVISPYLAVNRLTEVENEYPGYKFNIKNRKITAYIRRKILNYRIRKAYKQNKINNKVNGFIFLGFSEYISREILDPVAYHIKKLNTNEAVIVRDNFKSHNINKKIDLSIWSFWSNDNFTELKKIKNSLEIATREIKKSVVFKSLIENSGTNSISIKKLFNWILNIYLPNLLIYIIIARAIMIKCKPGLIVSPDVHDPRSRIFTMVGKIFNIKTLEIQFSFYNSLNVEWKFFIADRLAVTGLQNQAVMIEHGIDSDKLTITGSPRYDRIDLFTNDCITKFRKNMGIEKSQHVLLFASQPCVPGAFTSKLKRNEMLKGIVSAATNCKNITLVIKPHPLENIKELQGLINKNSKIVYITKDTDIRNLIQICDVFLTYTSNTTFDAIILNKPTINVSYPNANIDTTFDKSGATLVAKCDEELAKIFEMIDKNKITEVFQPCAKYREDFIEKWFFQIDGKSTERIAAICMKMIK